jgi:transcriptional regulator with XRE-family HTH domain
MDGGRGKRVLQQPLECWLFWVEPYPEESFGHFLGRFRRANLLSSGHLSAMLGLSAHIVSYWEAPSRRRIPGAEELKQLSQLLGVEETRLRAMWVPNGERLHLRTRLCPQCYVEAPYHKWTWQRANTAHCERHQQKLRSACSCCGTDFLLPAYWQKGPCDRCE